MASIWAVILGRYAESEMINMGLGHVSSDDHGGILEVSWKRKMDYWTSPRSAVANVKDLFHLQSWKICPASQEHYANFNTGIVLYEGEIGARPDVPNGIPCSGDQVWNRRCSNAFDVISLRPV